MDKFDLIVIGSGAGAHVAPQAANDGSKVALLDQGPTGRYLSEQWLHLFQDAVPGFDDCYKIAGNSSHH